MKSSLLVIALILTASPSLACSPEEGIEKATEVNQKLEELAGRNPQKADKIVKKMREAQNVTDLDSECKLYDEILAELPG